MNRKRPVPTLTLLAMVTASMILAGCMSQTGYENPEWKQETREFELKPDSSMEFKLRVAEGDNVDYSWSATRTLIYDFHGDTGGTSHETHKKGIATNDEDRWIAPFEGNHGWWWQNNNKGSVTITLHTEGTYTVIGIV